MTLVDPETGEVVRLNVYEARFTGLIHPAADRYPRMKEQQLGEMALDIADNGQREPIWVDADGTLLDGRNRLAACQMVGVEPHFAMYTGEDVEAFIVSKNEHRRHLSVKEQKELRQRRVAELREKNMSTRAIPAELDVSHSTVIEDLHLEGDLPNGDRPEDSPPARGYRLGWSDDRERSFFDAYEAAQPGGKALVVQGHGLTSRAAQSLAARLRKKYSAAAPAPATKADKVERIRQLASTSMAAKQIGVDVGLDERTVRAYARQAGLTLHAEKVIGRTHRLKTDKVITGIVERVSYDMENDSALAAVDLADADPSLIDGWVSSLDQSIRSLTTLRRKLKELTHG